MELILRKHHGVSFFSCPHPDWAGAAHGFSTRVGGVSPYPCDSLNLGANRGDDPRHVGENFRRFCAAVGSDSSALVKNRQVHGALVRPVTEADVMSDPAQPGMAQADGLITDRPGICLTIFSADCIPILFYDPHRRVVAASHAGWRGTAAGIAEQTVKTMTEDYGCHPAHILAAIGPGIGPCCFETHSDVPDGLRLGLGGDSEDFIVPIPHTEKFRVDLKGVNARLLKRSGLLPEHIALCPHCTACRPDLFWSHRRTGTVRGSMAAMIQLL